MSDGERGDNRQVPSLVSQAYGHSSSEEEPQSTHDETSDADNLEHDDLLSYETVSETPLDASSTAREENISSQELMSSDSSSEGETISIATTLPSPNVAQAENEIEGKFIVSIFLIFLIVLEQPLARYFFLHEFLNARFLD